MQIMTIDQALVDKGRTAFNLASLQFLCGPNSSVYEVGKRRMGGFAVVPGAIVAAIEQGFTTHSEIVRVVAQVSRCREATVLTLLESLSADSVPDALWWLTSDGTYDLVEGRSVNPFTVLTS